MAERDYLSEIRRLWALQLRRGGTPLEPADLLLCASDREAVELALGRLVQPGDVVLWAEPMPGQAALTTLAAGARYLDVGRAHQGLPDAAAVALALQTHPHAVFWGEVPALTCADDLAGPAALPARARIADCTAAAWDTELPDADACVLALRDPDSPGEPMLYGVATRPGWGSDLESLHGRGHFSERAQLHALAVLEGLAEQPRWPDHRRTEAADLAAQFFQAARDWPGAVPAGQFGLRAAVRCLAGDPHDLAVRLHPQFLQLRALPAHPAGSLLWLDLTGQLPLRHWQANGQTFDHKQGGG
ncbi:MAG: hypothetical protein HY902_17075 [Deltaproteobacteria bacterium]|nr:hypothetical protein [Deltaproteobacteria bacterium]